MVDGEWWIEKRPQQVLLASEAAMQPPKLSDFSGYYAGARWYNKRLTKQNWLPFAVVAVLVLLLSMFVGSQLRGQLWPGISAKGYRRIEKGMTLAQVRALLGEPGIHGTGPSVSLPTEVTWWDGRLVIPPQAARWEGPEGTIWVAFDESGRVIGKMIFYEPGSVREDFWTNLRDWWNELNYKGAVR
jgi:hypothetical protein